MRAILVDWIIDIHNHYNFEQKTLFNTIYIIDAYLSKNIIETKKLWDELTIELNELQKILRPSGFDFGFRVIDEILKFMLVAYKFDGQEKFDWKRYFDAAIKQKILPKIHGTEKSLKNTITKLIEFCDDYPTSLEKLEEMEKVLHDQKFVSFIN